MGAGAGGILVAMQLLRQARRPVNVLLIEQRRGTGPGVAYSTREPSHRLNVPAAKMSALPDDPDDFFRWAQRVEPGTRPWDFVSRERYGQYLNAKLREAERTAVTGSRLKRLNTEVVNLTREDSCLQLRCGDGAVAWARKVVLALGNDASADLSVPDNGLYRSRRYVPSPWSGGALMHIPNEAPVLLLGTGLTAVDTVLALRDHGHCGTIHTLSRHGLLPRAHEHHVPTSVGDWSRRLQGQSVRRLLSEVRRVATNVAGGWRAAVDALRPETQRLWRELPLQEQLRFLRHVRPYWDVHRHRMPPQVASTIHELLLDGRLIVHAGRALSFQPMHDEIEVSFQPRGHAASQHLRVSYVVNCTGPASSIRGTRSPLLLSLMAKGLARPDSHAMGLDWDVDGALLNQHGERDELIYGVGPMRRGQLWETTAIPEIRAQAQELAQALLQLPRQDQEGPRMWA